MSNERHRSVFDHVWRVDLGDTSCLTLIGFPSRTASSEATRRPHRSNPAAVDASGVTPANWPTSTHTTSGRQPS